MDPKIIKDENGNVAKVIEYHIIQNTTEAKTHKIAALQEEYPAFKGYDVQITDINSINDKEIRLTVEIKYPVVNKIDSKKI